MGGQALLPALSELVVFATAVFVLNATPGVDLLLTLSRTLQGGVRAGVAAALGINAGCVLHAVAAAFGLAAALALVPAAFQAIQWAGAVYLVVLGLGMWRRAWSDRRGQLPEAELTPSRSWAAEFRTGLLTNLLNPKVALFFLAFLPQFVPVGSPNKMASFLLLGLWFVVQSLLFLLFVVALAMRLGRLGVSGRVRQFLNGLGGTLFLLLALKLVWGGLREALQERPLAA